MTTATLATGNRTMTDVRPRSSLEELVDRLMAALFRAEPETAPQAETREARWAYAEWTDLVRRRFGDRGALVYSQGTGKAAALVPTGDGTLEVAAVLGMRWEPGKLVSRRSLRGLRPLAKACPRP